MASTTLQGRFDAHATEPLTPRLPAELGQRNLDFSFFKNIPVSERFKLQFRSEFFNAFNTPYFGQPNNIGFDSTDSLVPDGSRDGEIRSLRTQLRIIQFGLKLFF